MSLYEDAQLSGAGHTAGESSGAFIQHQLRHTIITTTTTTITTHAHALLALSCTRSAERTSPYQSHLERTGARQQGGMILRWRDIISARSWLFKRVTLFISPSLVHDSEGGKEEKEEETEAFLWRSLDVAVVLSCPVSGVCSDHCADGGEGIVLLVLSLTPRCSHAGKRQS